MTRGVRAVVVDDSQFMRTVISDMLENGGIEVVATAADGEEAVGTVIDHEPDVVTMDIEMPNVDGITAVERIMARRPTPILILSAHAGENADVTFEAMEKGAVDFFTKPGGEVSAGMGRHEDRLVEKARSVARSDVSAADTGASTDWRAGDSPADRARTRTYQTDATVIIGASTGGPSAVEQVMGSLPREAELRVLVVQHMPDEFTGRFASRLDGRSAYDVREATDGCRVDAGEAVVAPGGYHMPVSRQRRGQVQVRLTENPPEHGVRPAIDVTMRTAADSVDGPLTGVILTGMGEDGAAGIRAIAEAGGATVVQDEETSAIFGMPSAAIDTGRVDSVLPIDDVADGIAEAVSGGA